MMEGLLVDTNVVLDLLGRRKPFHVEAQQLFSLREKNEVRLFISVLIFANAHYIMTRQLDAVQAKRALRKLKILVGILPVSERTIELALNSDFGDFEDAIQYFSAIESHINVIITRNQKAFKHATLPVLWARVYLSMHDPG